MSPNTTICPTMFTFTFLVILFTTHLTRVGPLLPSYHGTQLAPRISGNEKIEQRYSVIFDAGSTGTRVSVFLFNVTINGDDDNNNNMTNEGQERDLPKDVKLEKTYFGSVKPGLSYYSSSPSDAASSLEPLLQLVTSVIDQETISRTPLLLKATAGLRLLPSTTADDILAAVRNMLLQKHKFIMNDESVSILDGDSEGIYSWMTINSLLGTISDPFNSVGVLDLGGGSAQVTFTPVIHEYLDLIPSANVGDFVTFRNIAGSKQVLYTHSYLGFGLMSARKGILIDSFPRDVNIETKISRIGSTIHLSHPCFKSIIGNPNIEHVNWKFEGISYNITPPSNETMLDGNCYQFAARFVTNHHNWNERKIDSPRELNDRTIYAISYFYDRAVDAGLIPRNTRHAMLKVKQFIIAAKKKCKKLDDNINHELLNSRYLKKRVQNSVKLVTETLNSCEEESQLPEDDPFLCLDLSYIAAFLKDGLKLHPNKELHVANQINGVEASWSLGAAYDLIYS